MSPFSSPGFTLGTFQSQPFKNVISNFRTLTSHFIYTFFTILKLQSVCYILCTATTTIPLYYYHAIKLLYTIIPLDYTITMQVLYYYFKTTILLTTLPYNSTTLLYHATTVYLALCLQSLVLDCCQEQAAVHSKQQPVAKQYAQAAMMKKKQHENTQRVANRKR